jgi:hypothetical protein
LLCAQYIVFLTYSLCSQLHLQSWITLVILVNVNHIHLLVPVDQYHLYHLLGPCNPVSPFGPIGPMRSCIQFCNENVSTRLVGVLGDFFCFAHVGSKTVYIWRDIESLNYGGMPPLDCRLSFTYDFTQSKQNRIIDFSLFFAISFCYFSNYV